MKPASLLLTVSICLFCIIAVPVQSKNVWMVNCVNNRCAKSLPKKVSCKKMAGVKLNPKAKITTTKIPETHFYSGTLNMLAQLFPVLFNFTDAKPEQTCTEV